LATAYSASGAFLLHEGIICGAGTLEFAILDKKQTDAKQQESGEYKDNRKKDNGNHRAFFRGQDTKL
jgi:hypothetical protein